MVLATGPGPDTAAPTAGVNWGKELIGVVQRRLPSTGLLQSAALRSVHMPPPPCRPYGSTSMYSGAGGYGSSMYGSGMYGGGGGYGGGMYGRPGGMYGSGALPKPAAGWRGVQPASALFAACGGGGDEVACSLRYEQPDATAGMPCGGSSACWRGLTVAAACCSSPRSRRRLWRRPVWASRRYVWRRNVRRRWRRNVRARCHG